MALTFSSKLVAKTVMGEIVDVKVDNIHCPNVQIHIVFLNSYMARIEFGIANAQLDFFVNSMDDELNELVRLSEGSTMPQRFCDIDIDLPETPPFECAEYPQLCSAYRSFRAELNTTWAEDHPEYAGLINSLKVLFTGIKS